MNRFMPKKSSIVLVDDEPDILYGASILLRMAGIQPLIVAATDKWHPRVLFCSQTAARNSLPQKMFGSADSH